MTEPFTTFAHGGDLKSASLASGRAERELLDFSANINPLGMPPGVREAVEESLAVSVNYPDPYCRELREAIAAHSGQKAEYILAGNGGADLIYRLVYALRPQRAFLTAPAFAEYEEALRQIGAQIDFWELGEEQRLTERYAQTLTAEHGLVFLCNPNNPTGILTEKALVQELLTRARELGTYVCVDECFLDFAEDPAQYSVADLLEDYPNLVILKSFTKLYAMPGLRLGCVLSANVSLLKKMQAAGQPWGVSAQAQAAGIAALAADRGDVFRQKTVALVQKERAFLQAGLEALGFAVYAGAANYLCFRAPDDITLRERLLARGILLRSCANYRGLGPDYYRAAVKKHEENEALLRALAAVTLGTGDR